MSRFVKVMVDGVPRTAEVVLVANPSAGGASGPITVLTDAAVTINATSTAIVPAQTGRTSVLITNTGSVPVFLKAGAAATTLSRSLAAGASIEYATTEAINGVVTTGTGTIYVTSEGRA